MAWMRLEVSYIDHPKFIDLTDGAFRLWHEGKSYCEKHLTDGLIPTAAIKSFRHYNERRAAELGTPPKGYIAPLWEPHDVGIKMHDYLDHNDSRERALGRMAKKKDENDRKRKNQEAYRDRKRAEREAAVTGSVTGHMTGNETETLPDRTATTTTATSTPSSSPTAHQHDLEDRVPRGRAKGHRRHVFCPPDGSDGFCVPEFLHQELETMLGGHVGDIDLLGWYLSTDAQRRVDRPTVLDGLDWWRQQLRAEIRRLGWASSPTRGRSASQQPEYEPWDCPHTPRCPHRAACHIVSQRRSA